MTQGFQRTFRTRVRRIDGSLYLAVDRQDVQLDETAEFLWHLLARPHTIDQLAEAVAQEYGITASDVRSDVAEVVADLTMTGFVRETIRP